jgi:MSHA biogenesis protein MshJ
MHKLKPLLPLAMTRAWARAARAFDRRARRERVLITLAAAAFTAWLLGATWLEGHWHQLRQQQQQRASAALALATLNQDAEQLLGVQQARQIQASAEIERLRRELGTVVGAAHAGMNLPGLVTPQQMLPLLQELLGRQHGLHLRSLQSLGQTRLQADGTAAMPPGGANPAAAPVPAAPPSPGGSSSDRQRQATLYRHAVELSVEGSYVDLLAYLHALEALPHKLLWGPIKLDVQHHPAVLLRLEVYTLSQQSTWVEL